MASTEHPEKPVVNEDIPGKVLSDCVEATIDSELHPPIKDIFSLPYTAGKRKTSQVRPVNLENEDDFVVPGHTGWVAKIVRMFERKTKEAQTIPTGKLEFKQAKWSPFRLTHVYLPFVNGYPPTSSEKRSTTKSKEGETENSRRIFHRWCGVSSSKESEDYVSPTASQDNLILPQGSVKAVQPDPWEHYRKTTTLNIDTSAKNEDDTARHEDVPLQNPVVSYGPCSLKQTTSPSKLFGSEKRYSPRKLFPALLSKTRSLLDVTRSSSKKSKGSLQNQQKLDTGLDDTCQWYEALDRDSKTVGRSFSVVDVKYRTSEPEEDPFAWITRDCNRDKSWNLDNLSDKQDDTIPTFLDIGESSSWDNRSSSDRAACLINKPDKNANTQVEAPNQNGTGKKVRNWMSKLYVNRKAKPKEAEIPRSSVVQIYEPLQNRNDSPVDGADSQSSVNVNDETFVSPSIGAEGKLEEKGKTDGGKRKRSRRDRSQTRLF